MIDNNVVNEILNKATRSRRLTSLFFEITSNCNLNCVHCYLGNKRKEPDIHIPLEKLIDILKEAKKLGVFDIAVTGGEVFTYKYWREFFAIIKQQGFNLVVFTNAVNLCEKDIAYMKKIGVNSIKISCYGMHKDTYEATTRIANSYEKYKRNIELLKKYKLYHFFSNIILSTNEKDCQEMLKANGTKNTELYIIDDLQHSNSPTNYRPCEEVWNKCHYDVMKEAEIDAHQWEDPNKYICTAGLARLAILPNGDVTPCINLRIPIGNIFHDSIKDIWNSPQLDTLFENFKIGKFEKCFTCPYKSYLTHICPGSNYNDTGNYYLPSEFKCNICKKNKEVIENK